MPGHIKTITADIRRLEPAEVRRIYRGDDTLLTDPPAPVAVLVALMLDAGRAAGCAAAAIAAPGPTGRTTAVIEGWIRTLLSGGRAVPPAAIVAAVRQWTTDSLVAPYARALADGGAIVDVSEIK